MEPMVLLTTLDERYLPQLQVLLTSLSIHNPGEKITLFLLHSGIPENRLSAVRRQCERLPHRMVGGVLPPGDRTR